VKLLLLFITLGMGLTYAQEKSSTEKLLDKIVAVINTKVISLSEVKRVEATL